MEGNKMEEDNFKDNVLKGMAEMINDPYPSCHEVKRRFECLKYFFHLKPDDFISILYAIIEKMLQINVNMRNVDYNNNVMVEYIKILTFITKEFDDCKDFKNHTTWLYVASKFFLRIIDLGYISWIKKNLYDYCIFLINQGKFDGYREDSNYIERILSELRKRELFDVENYYFENNSWVFKR